MHPLRPNGFLVLIGIVVLGLGSGAAYLHYKAPILKAEYEAELEAAPKTPLGRLDHWLEFGGPQIHHRLSKFARFSAELPWIVTHAVADEAGGPPEIWGVDCSEIPRDVARLEGMTVVVELPRPRPLGRVALNEAELGHVPLYPRGAAPSPAETEARLVDLAVFFLEGLPAALEREIEGASLSVRVAPRGA